MKAYAEKQDRSAQLGRGGAQACKRGGGDCRGTGMLKDEVNGRETHPPIATTHSNHPPAGKRIHRRMVPQPGQESSPRQRTGMVRASQV